LRSFFNLEKNLKCYCFEEQRRNQVYHPDEKRRAIFLFAVRKKLEEELWVMMTLRNELALEQMQLYDRSVESKNIYYSGFL